LQILPGLDPNPDEPDAHEPFEVEAGRTCTVDLELPR